MKETERSVKNRLVECLDEGLLALLDEFTRIHPGSWEQPDAHRTWAHARRSLYEDLRAIHAAHVRCPQDPEGS